MCRRLLRAVIAVGASRLATLLVRDIGNRTNSDAVSEAVLATKLYDAISESVLAMTLLVSQYHSYDAISERVLVTRC